MKRYALVLLLLTLVGCQHAPPNLTPQAVVAFHGTQVIHDLDRIRDAADAAHKTTPPLIDAATELKIVNWHQSAIVIVHSAPAGWQASVGASLEQLEKQLSDKDKQVVGPYIAVAKAILAEVAK